MLRGCGPRLIVNGPFSLEKDLPHEVGLHLTSTELGRLEAIMGERLRLVGCSCHTREELTKAEALGFDYALLSPVASTAKYLDKSTLGWSGFEELAGSVSLPVYALGGMKRSDVRIALKRGAVGVAGIGAFDKTAGYFVFAALPQIALSIAVSAMSFSGGSHISTTACYWAFSEPSPPSG